MSGVAQTCSTRAPIRLTLIAATTMANGLGVSGTLPWRLKGEMGYFRSATTNVAPNDDKEYKKNAVIMGRKTWESIPPKFRPLKDRVNIVISRAGDEAALGIRAEEGSWLFRSLDEAVAFLNPGDATGQKLALSRAFVIGGAQLYSECMARSRTGDLPYAVVDRLLITRILAPDFPECDAFFPEYRDAQQMDEEAKLSIQLQGEKEDRPALPTPVERRAWLKSSSKELQDYLGFDQSSGAPMQNLDDIVTEQGTSYQFQMWTKQS